MADLRARTDDGRPPGRPRLRREVILPKSCDEVAFHRRIAVLSILIAMLAGSLDAMLWRASQRRAAHEQRPARVERVEHVAPAATGCPYLARVHAERSVADDSVADEPAPAIREASASHESPTHHEVLE